MKKKMITILTATTMLVSSVVLTTACDGGNDKDNNEAMRNMYAMSAVSSIAYLSSGSVAENQALAAPMAQPPATVRPETIVDNDVSGIENCLAMFDGIITGGGFEQTVKDNTSENALFGGYAFTMEISLHDATGKAQAYTMYFNETGRNTEVEEDDGERETEETVTFEGVVAYGDELFVVKGERETETEGAETENSIEFITYRNIGTDTVAADLDNYVVVEQSFETDEVDYEYTFVQNGKVVQKMELEYEQERRGEEVSFQWKDLSTGVKNETEYTVKKGAEAGKFVVEFEKNGAKDAIQITKLENGGYTFVYSNGYSETVHN